MLCFDTMIIAMCVAIAQTGFVGLPNLRATPCLADRMIDRMIDRMTHSVRCMASHENKEDTAAEFPKLADADSTWHVLGTNAAEQVVDRYFGKLVAQGQQCDVFCIHGIPAAVMVFTERNCHGDPIVDAFMLNRAMLLLFDASPVMRRTLFQKYRRISMKNAIGRDEFLME